MIRNAFFKTGACAALVLSLTPCDPYNPASRAVGGGLLGGAAGAGISGIAGGDPATGALLGAGVGALGGALSTPERPRPHGRHWR